MTNRGKKEQWFPRVAALNLNSSYQIVDLREIVEAFVARLDQDPSQVETNSTDENKMELMLFSTFSVLAFCVCCRMLIKTFLSPIPVFNTQMMSRTALRFRKSYSVFAWGLMTVTFLMSLVVSFIQVYTTL